MVPALRAARQMRAGVLEGDLVAAVRQRLADRRQLHRDLGLARQPGRRELLEQVDVRRHGGLGLVGVEGVLAEEVEGDRQAVVDQPPGRRDGGLGRLSGDVAADDPGRDGQGADQLLDGAAAGRAAAAVAGATTWRTGTPGGRPPFAQGVRRRSVAAPSASPAEREGRDDREVAPDLASRVDRVRCCIASTAYDSGSTSLIASSTSGSRSRGTNSPHSRICGITTSGMNCTAWNSVCANARDEQAQRGAQHRVGDRDHAEQPDRPGDVEAEQADADRDGQRGLDGGHQPEGERVAEQEVELAHRHREQPLEGAAGALAQRGDAGHQEHHDEREQRQQRRADPVEDVAGRPRTSTTAG